MKKQLLLAIICFAFDFAVLNACSKKEVVTPPISTNSKLAIPIFPTVFNGETATYILINRANVIKEPATFGFAKTINQQINLLELRFFIQDAG